MLINSLFKHWSYRIFAPGTILREKYEALKQLLHFDSLCHEQMAEFQDLVHGEQREDLTCIRKRFTHFSKQVAGMIDCLETMAPGRYFSLKSYHKKFDFYTRFLLAPPKIDFAPPFVLALEELSVDSKHLGNKAKHSAVIQNELGIAVPLGFAVSTGGYHYFIEDNNLRGPIDDLLTELNIHSPHSLTRISHKLTEIILKAEVPPEIEESMLAAYDRLFQACGGQINVAVRSSAISEDGDCSFAGQYATILHVKRNTIGKAYREVIASKYSPEALFYRVSHGLGDEETAMSVLVQEMVSAVCSGVMYTKGVMQEAMDQEHLHLHVTRGLGDKLVGGEDIPDNYILTRRAPPSLVSEISEISSEPIISEEQATMLARQGMDIESYFDTPQDIEWAIDDTGQLFILQARPLRISSQDEASEDPQEHNHLVLFNNCERASTGVAAGVVYLIDGSHMLEDVPAGVVLVTRDSPPDYVKVMNRLSAVIAERGSRASHFATVAREFGVPYLAGTAGAVDRLKPGSIITVDGNKGIVYEGRIDSLIQKGPTSSARGPYHRIVNEALKFITPLELIDPAGENFTPEGCRSLHDIVRFCHEKALHSMFTTGKPGTGRGALRLIADIPLDVFLFDVGGGIATEEAKRQNVPLAEVASVPFQALWQGLSHPGVQWKQKPFDWEAYDKIELAGGVPPKKDSFAFASYAVIGADYLHFNIRFGYHFTIVDVMCGKNSAENHCMLRFAGGGGDYDHRSLRIDFISSVLERLEFSVEKKGDLLEAKLPGMTSSLMKKKLDMLGRLLGATKLMDMVLKDEHMVAACVEDFYKERRYSFSQEG